MPKPTKYYSNIQESQIANYLGWKQVSGSGARNFHPGDIVSDKWLGECKTHTSPDHNLVINFEVWSKIKEEATSQFKSPVLFIDDGSQLLKNTRCVLQLDSKLDGIKPDIEVNPLAKEVSFKLSKIIELESISNFQFLLMAKGPTWFIISKLDIFLEISESYR